MRFAQLTIAVFVLLVVAPAAASARDSDRDGLPNSWESNKTAPGGLHLRALGANPKHKDIFVELDFSSAAVRNQVTCKQLGDLVKAFRTAPVNNPDGRRGINLHLDAGKRCGAHDYDLGGSTIVHASSGCPGVSEAFNALGLAKIAANRIHVFHHAGIFGQFCDPGGDPGGVAEVNGTQMIVATPGGTFATVFMHELGHNLGLTHPPATAVTHLGVMQIAVYRTCQSCQNRELLDYQRFPTPALDEHALSEETGLGTPLAHNYFAQWTCAAGTNHANGNPAPTLVNSWPGDRVDWNCSGDPFYPFAPGSVDGIDPGTVSADINGDGMLSVIPGHPVEWTHLDYRAGGAIGPQHARAARQAPRVVG